MGREMYGRSEGRRRLAESLSAAQDADTPQLDEFEKGVAEALVRRGIVTDVPGRESAADIEWAEYRARTRRVLDALRAPAPPAPDSEPEVQQSLPDQLKSLIAQQHGTDQLPLNGTALIRHAMREVGPGGSATGGQPAGGSA